jgi:hypothetical protein
MIDSTDDFNARSELCGLAGGRHPPMGRKSSVLRSVRMKFDMVTEILLKPMINIWLIAPINSEAGARKTHKDTDNFLLSR